ncbi:MAG: type III-B CRISPR module-associated Cmr3 family protein [Chromatiaceae bacterium]
MSKKPNKSPRYEKHKGQAASSAGAGPRPAAQPPHTKPSERTSESRTLTLDPLAPLICRSGRPFDDQAGPDGARFPPPSTVAGTLRTAWARQSGRYLGKGMADEQVAELMGVSVAGPLLACPDRHGRLGLLAPKPADALYFGAGDAARCVRAAPRLLPESCGMDLPDNLLPVYLDSDGKEKPGPGPAWWAWEDLLDFRRGNDLNHAQIDERGWSPPTGDLRTHVAIDRNTLAAESGRLFQTEGLDLAAPEGLKEGAAEGFKLLVRCAEPLAPALVHLGGERRLARLEPRPDADWPEAPPGWIEDISRAGGVVLTLLSPGLFGGGYRPGWLKPNTAGWLEGTPALIPSLQLRLRAAALGRWQPHSGWDLAAQKARAGRKMVPAGAVYWFQILGDPTAADLEALWLTNLCDHIQDRRDGFGLALPAAWTPPGSAASDHPK